MDLKKSRSVGRQSGSSRSGQAPKVSDLGKRLREISDKALASGVRTLSSEEIGRMVSEARGVAT